MHQCGDKFTAYDAEEYGEAVQASIIISNTPPSLSEIWVEPEVAYVTDPLTCALGTITDDDGETDFAITYQWFVNGIETEVTTNQLPTDFFIKSDSVYCAATPADASEPGTTVTSAPITINNTINNITFKKSPADIKI